MTIYICVGSGCHLKGSYDIINLFKEMISKKQLSDQITLKASFCLGNCMSGVSIKVNDEIITNINKENFNSVFEEKIMPRLK